MAIPGNLLSPTTEAVDPNTSGWAAKLNCTLALGSGGRNGDGALDVLSVSAGEMQARTVTSYPVMAGVLYETFADASASAAPERIGIRWLDSSGAEISITWSMTTASASASWHRVSVAGTAPAGTVKAQVVLSSTEAGAGVAHFWENVYLGLPIRTLGNLLPYTTESSEVDTSGWTSLGNSTISRRVPALAWSVGFYLAGGHTLAMTATAAGNASMRTVRQPCTPGIEYEAYCFLNPPTSGSNTWIELKWYDFGGSPISSVRSTLAAPGTGWYRQRVSDMAPAGAELCALAVGIDSASAGQVLGVETAVIAAATVLQSGTVLPLADGSFEQGVGAWTTASGVATLARTSPWGAAAVTGSYALAITSSTASASTLRSGRYPLTGDTGQNWRAQIAVHIASGTWGPVGVRTRWYDADDTDLGTGVEAAFALPDSVHWFNIFAEGSPPEGATQAAVEVVVTATSAGAVLQMDAVSLWPVLPLSDLEAHDAGGYITVTLRELPVGGTVSVYRVMPDSSRVLVRGASGLLEDQPVTSDLMVIEDHEAPFGVALSYHIELTDAAGNASTRSVSSVTLTIDDINTAWIKDPGNPQRNLLVMVQAAPDWERPIEQATTVVKGRRNKVTLSGVRNGLEGDLSIWTRSDDERAALHLLLDSGNVLLWQAMPGMGVDDMYVNVGSIGEGRIGGPAQEPWRAWTLPLTEADMPVTTGVNGARGRTWQDILSEFATWGDLMAVYATWEDVFLDRRKG